MAVNQYSWSSVAFFSSAGGRLDLGNVRNACECFSSYDRKFAAHAYCNAWPEFVH